MFHSARIKLTTWYLLIIMLIIMLISVIFSVVIYRVIMSELQRFAEIQRARYERQIQRSELPTVQPIDPDLLKESSQRLILILIGIDFGILLFAGGIGYWLAGLTLQPIQEMVDEQNRFIADASHEFRTPLTSLKSSIEVNLRDKKLSLVAARELLESNLEEVNRLQSLSDALLELAQYETSNSKNNLDFETVVGAKVLAEAIKKVEPLAKEKNITIVQKIEKQELEADSKALCELFVILLDNAVKYSPESSTIRVYTSTTDSHYIVVVEDQGMGIDAKDQPHIFDRFYRADTSRSKENSSGYGLGLSIAKKIITMHNGSIEISKSDHTGTTFVVELPLKHTKKA